MGNVQCIHTSYCTRSCILTHSYQYTAAILIATSDPMITWMSLGFRRLENVDAYPYAYSTSSTPAPAWKEPDGSRGIGPGSSSSLSSATALFPSSSNGKTGLRPFPELDRRPPRAGDLVRAAIVFGLMC